MSRQVSGDIDAGVGNDRPIGGVYVVYGDFSDQDMTRALVSAAARTGRAFGLPCIGIMERGDDPAWRGLSPSAPVVWFSRKEMDYMVADTPVVLLLGEVRTGKGFNQAFRWADHGHAVFLRLSARSQQEATQRMQATMDDRSRHHVGDVIWMSAVSLNASPDVPA